METTYKWVISAMDIIPSLDGLTDVVSIVHWKREATQGDALTDIYGIMTCGQPSETDFTAYADLTYEKVCEWLEAGLDVEELNTILDNKIKNIINPTIIKLLNPWDTIIS